MLMCGSGRAASPFEFLFSFEMNVLVMQVES